MFKAMVMRFPWSIVRRPARSSQMPCPAEGSKPQLAIYEEPRVARGRWTSRESHEGLAWV